MILAKLNNFSQNAKSGSVGPVKQGFLFSSPYLTIFALKICLWNSPWKKAMLPPPEHYNTKFVNTSQSNRGLRTRRSQLHFWPKWSFWYQNDPYNTENNLIVPTNNYKAIVAWYHPKHVWPICIFTFSLEPEGPICHIDQ